ncbi:MAG: succinylglutamate desuccinylase/aspartoacylase family protein [Reichenbachiella sp.]|uniref:succinylglutamate desuccinylase/aspartoacylase family protein n=1 Tax=Reichenbachiella sp. TaxID=2184521 RepID=UPI0032644F9A
MIKVHNKVLNRTVEVGRIIAKIEGEKPGPTVVFFGGIHGNENTGLLALHQVGEELSPIRANIKGNIYAISGNLCALEKGTRFCAEDLNRIWTSDAIKDLQNGFDNQLINEKKEQYEIYKTIHDIIEEEEGPFYFMDLHTTSSESIPFVIVNDSLLNRRFAEQFPVPMILGVEEYLEGPILSYINEMGYVSFGYEAGQHDDPAAFQNQLAFIYLSLAFAGSVDKELIEYYHYYEQLAKTSATSRDIFEISFRFEIKDGQEFQMKPGFVNFQKVKKGQEMATLSGKTILASNSGRVFMPLYQNQGKEGFFEIKKVHPFFLRLSAVLRKTKLAHLLPFLPGIRWKSAEHDAMVVNLNVARFLAKPFLHLLGYRSKHLDKNHLVIKNREAASKADEYQTEWNK